MTAAGEHDQHDVTDVHVKDGVAHLDLWYPRIEGSAHTIEIGLMDVRAADSIRVSYDFDRDGWKIEQASIFQWKTDDEVCDGGWTEVAFVEAWASEKGNEEDE